MLDTKPKFHALVVETSCFVVCVLLVLVWGTKGNAQNQTNKSQMVKAHTVEAQQPLYREYRGVRLGMTAEEARAKLGAPVLKSDEQDFYVLSENETAQIAYNSDRKVVTISTDYTGGVGAPDYRTVVGAGLQERPDGSSYKSVLYDAELMFVSYNKSAGSVPVVTITLQRMK
jgi:hypothetical protein